jgi:hypothetical protein
MCVPHDLLLIVGFSLLSATGAAIIFLILDSWIGERLYPPKPAEKPSGPAN